MHLSSAWVRPGQWLVLAAVLLVGLTFLLDHSKRVRDGPVLVLICDQDASAQWSFALIAPPTTHIVYERLGESWFQPCVFNSLAKPGAPVTVTDDVSEHKTLDTDIVRCRAPPGTTVATTILCKTAFTC